MIHPRQQYKGQGSGWCLVPYCKQGAKWFTCANCNKVACGYHQIFDLDSKLGPVVCCYYCRPDIWDIKTGRRNDKAYEKFIRNTKTQEGSLK